MQNPYDDSSQNNSLSSFDALMPFSGLDSYSHTSDRTDLGWQDSDYNYFHDPFHPDPLTDLSHPDHLTDDFGQMTDYGDCSDHSQHSYDMGGISGHERYARWGESRASVFHSAGSTNSDDERYITINSYGTVYMHERSDTNYVGDVSGGTFSNKLGRTVGYFGADGYVHDRSGDRLGWVEAGHIYNTARREIGHCTTDLEGAAYLIFAVHGGVE